MAIPFKLLGRTFAVPALTVGDFPGAVDVFVYDTTQDSDGGAWTNGPLAQASSWYNETLNTATRGSRRDFPKVAVIVAEATRVVIYDGEDPALPMWMIANRYSTGYSWVGFTTSQATSLSASSGRIFVGSRDTLSGFRSGAAEVDFVKDAAVLYTQVASPRDLGDIGQRNAGLWAAAPVPNERIVNQVVNDITARVLPGAPTDPTTGLKVPTVLVGTDGGLSIIKDNGTVVDVVHSTWTIASEVGWRESDNAICYTADSGATTGRFRLVRHDVPATDLSLSSPWLSGQSDELYPMYPSAGYTGTGFPLSPSSSMASRGWIGEADAGSTQLTLFAPKPADPANGMRAVVTSTYNTGWMHGDTVGSFMCDTSTAALVGGTDNDRSPYNTPLTVNGTVTRTAVAAGADIVAYSGFSASNYLEQPYNSNLDFGTGDFCVMGWVKKTSNSGVNAYLARTAISSSGGGFFVGDNSGVPAVYRGGSSSLSLMVSGGSILVESWSLVCAVKKNSVLSLYVNGQVVGSVSNTLNWSFTNPVVRLGIHDGASVYALLGSLALWRISATAPDADQIAKIYADELKLFQPDAACTLAGTSSDVRAVDYDRTTGRVQALASDGWLSSFRGLVRRDQQSTGRSVAMSSRRNKVIVT